MNGYTNLNVSVQKIVFSTPNTKNPHFIDNSFRLFKGIHVEEDPSVLGSWLDAVYSNGRWVDWVFSCDKGGHPISFRCCSNSRK